MIRRGVILAGLGLLAASALAGCQSTQATSAEKAENGDKLLHQGSIEIGKENTDIEVVSATLIPGPDTSAVAVQLHNNSAEGFANVPIQLNVLDAKGKSVFKNDAKGTDPTLIGVPVIQPNADVWWVHDQIFAIGKPDSVKVTVGSGADPLPELPEVDAEEPKVEHDSISDLDEATGDIENPGDEDLRKVYLYAVAVKDGKAVAAGRGAIDKLKADAAKPEIYNIFFVGDPTGAEIEFSATPTFLEE